MKAEKFYPQSACRAQKKGRKREEDL